MSKQYSSEVRENKLNEIVDFFKKYKKENNGRPPTIRELVENTFLSSTSHAVFWLKMLVERGVMGHFFPDTGRKSVYDLVDGHWVTESETDTVKQG